MNCPSRPIIATFKDENTRLNEVFIQRQGALAEQGTVPGLRGLLVNRSKIIDRSLRRLWKLNALDESGLALFAVGGYGRREVFPGSDIDILILHRGELTPIQTSNIESFIHQLWDLGPPVGQSVRSLDACMELAGEDHTILTTLLNSRKIAAKDDQFLSELRSHLQTNSVASSEAFFKLKKDEYRARHLKHSNTEYNLEPNTKEAPGGLRDIHALLWISKYTLGMGSLAKLSQKAILNPEELHYLQNGYDFVASVRYSLHIMAGRDENRLLFDYQKKIAQVLGFTGNGKNEAVEKFMKAYYRHVSTIAAIVDLLLENVQEEIIADTKPEETPINPRFMLIGKKIAVTHDQVFVQNPSALLEMFYLLGEFPSPVGVRANTIRLLRASRHQIDDRFRNSRTNTSLFLQILQSPYRLFTQLQRMKRFGILGRYLPEFGQVIGQMQYDLFHVYTVDAHALLVVQNMRVLRHTQARQSFPLASKILHGLANRTLLYIAGLFHDIAKGRDGDHSILGAQDVKLFCERHRLSTEDTQLITWLVLDHLIMSVTAQKQDISDIKVIEDFADKVQDQERLDYLYLLTICDIGATNPKLLNPWRLSLINQLYLETTQLFKRQIDRQDPWSGRTCRIKAKAAQFLQALGIQAHHYEELWQGFGDNYFSKYSAQDIAWHTEAILQHASPKEPLVIAGLTQESSTQVYTQIFVHMPDCPFLFVNSVAVLSDLGLNILDARVITSKTHFTLNTYIVDDDDTGIIANTPQIYRKICASMTERLATVKTVPSLCPALIPRRHKHFDVQTLVRIHNPLDEPYTIVSIETLDRQGLLALLGCIFAQHKLSVLGAKILTFGERAEDFFYLSCEGAKLTDQGQTQALFQALMSQLKTH